MSLTSPSPHFDWIRFWLPRTEPLDLKGGFLPDPEDEFDRFRNSALRTLDSLGESPVLVLLGDPGMGKTTTLADEAIIRVDVVDGRIEFEQVMEAEVA